MASESPAETELSHFVSVKDFIYSHETGHEVPTMCGTSIAVSRKAERLPICGECQEQLFAKNFL